MCVVRTMKGVFQLSKLRLWFQHIKKMSGLGLARLKLKNVGCQLCHHHVGSQSHQGSQCQQLVGSYCHQLVGCYEPHHHLRKSDDKETYSSFFSAFIFWTSSSKPRLFLSSFLIYYCALHFLALEAAASNEQALLSMSLVKLKHSSKALSALIWLPFSLAKIQQRVREKVLILYRGSMLWKQKYILTLYIMLQLNNSKEYENVTNKQIDKEIPN